MYAIEPSQPITVIARPHPFRSDRIIRSVPSGPRINEIIDDMDLESTHLEARVFLDGVLIEKAYWHRVKPEGGHRLTIRVIPQGGGGQGKDVLRVVAMVGVLALAIAAPYLAPAALGLTATVGGVTVLSTAGGLVAGAFAIAGSLRILSLIPPPHSLRQIGDHR